MNSYPLLPGEGGRDEVECLGEGGSGDEVIPKGGWGGEFGKSSLFSK